MIIWKHFFFNFIKTVMAVLCLLLVLFLAITYIENSLYYFKKNTVSLNILFQFYFWQLPNITIQILPFAVLISGIIVHWSLARSEEISALRIAGMPWWHISFPLMCGALFYVILHFALSEFATPLTLKKFNYVKNTLIENIADKNIFVDTTWVKSNHGILHFEKYNAQTQTLGNVEFFEYNMQHNELKSIAKSQSAIFDDKKNLWVLHDATITNFEKDKEYQVSQMPYFYTDVHFAPPKILRDTVSSDELSYLELSSLIDSAIRAHMNVSDRLVDLYLKTSQPFSNLLFLLFTIPFAFMRERHESSYLNILICLGVTITYWTGNLIFRNLSIHGFLPPIFAAWGLNILFGIFILSVIIRLDKPA